MVNGHLWINAFLIILSLFCYQADRIQINLLIIRLRLRCPRDELAAATARKTCSNRAHANPYVKQPLDANTYLHVFEANIPTKYMQIHAYIAPWVSNTAVQYMILTRKYPILTCQYPIDTWMYWVSICKYLGKYLHICFSTYVKIDQVVFWQKYFREVTNRINDDI